MPLTPEERLARKRARQKRYREAHRANEAYIERKRVSQQRYQRKNRAKITATQRQRRHANLERSRAINRIQGRRWRAKNPDRYQAIEAKSQPKYRANHRDALNAKQRQLRLDAPDRVHAWERKSRAKHRDTRQITIKAWNKAHPEKTRQATAKWRETHPDKVEAYKPIALEQSKAWRKAHPEYARAAVKRRRARKRAVPRADLTHTQWVMIQEAQDHCCAYCGKRCKGHLTQDHITPLSQGGAHTLHNVVGACRSCNSRKHTGPPLTAVQPLLL